MKATQEQMDQAGRVTRFSTGQSMLCSEVEWASAIAQLQKTGVHHAVIDVGTSNLKSRGGYTAIVPDTPEGRASHDHRGVVTVLASTARGREY